MLARLQGQALYGFSFAGNRVVPKTKCCTQQLHAWYMCVCVFIDVIERKRVTVTVDTIMIYYVSSMPTLRWFQAKMCSSDRCVTVGQFMVTYTIHGAAGHLDHN